MKSRTSFVIFAVFAFMVCAACDVRVVDRVEDPQTPTSVEPMGPVVVAGRDWNAYHVHVPAALTGSAVRKSRWDIGTKTFVGASYLPATIGAPFEDHDVQPGQVYVYEWGSVKSSVFNPEGRARVAIPLDLEVRGDVADDSDTAKKLFTTARFGRLIFREGVVLTTMGRDLQWEADSAVFEETVVRSFAPNAKGAIGQHGRSGGRLLLRARVARGNLRFEGRGENGGDGLPGAKPTADLKGRTGPAAPMPPGSFQRSGTFGLDYYCSEHALKGGAGESGRQGFSGGAGGDGGDSGDLMIDIADRSALSIQTFFDIGHGGLGGVGGEGGEGGDGGNAMVAEQNGQGATTYYNCGSRLPGDRGTRGPQGLTGPKGASGQYRQTARR